MNWVLLNYADYENTGCIKRLLKSKGALYKLAESGDQVAHSIYIDLKDAMQSLTPKQLDYILQWLEGYTQNEIAAHYGVGRDDVTHLICNGCRKIKGFLLKLS